MRTARWPRQPGRRPGAASASTRRKHVTSVRVLARYVVELEFQQTERRTIDLEPLLEGPAFEELLRDYGLFLQIAVDPDLATIAWPNGADLSPRTLYSRSRPSVPVGRAG